MLKKMEENKSIYVYGKLLVIIAVISIVSVYIKDEHKMHINVQIYTHYVAIYQCLTIFIYLHTHIHIHSTCL